MADMHYDLAVVGAGPAGLAATKVAAAAGLRVVVLDDQMKAGGQIYRQPFAQDLYPPERFGRSHREAGLRMDGILAQDNVRWLRGTNVVGLQQGRQRGFTLFCHAGETVSELAADRVLVAAGCHDMAVPFPGWTVPGVMGAGGIQAMMKGQGVVPGRAVVLAGSHPLLLVIAAQLHAFGCTPKAVIFAQSPARVAAVLRSPLTAIRNAGVFAEGARAYLALRRAGVRIVFNKAVLAAMGTERLERIVVGSVKGRPEFELECDSLGLGYGFTASTELLRQIGVDFSWQRAGGGWVANHGADMQSNIPGLYVAGEVAGIGGAPTADVEGRLAGLAIVSAAGRPAPRGSVARLARQRRRRRRFAELLAEMADPGEALLRAVRSDDTTICRCEGVTVASLRQSLHDNPHLSTLNAAKLLTRVGMGPCQGRFCQAAVTEEIMSARSGRPAATEPYTARFPVRPVPLTAFVQRDGAGGKG